MKRLIKRQENKNLDTAECSEDSVITSSEDTSDCVFASTYDLEKYIKNNFEADLKEVYGE